MRQLYEAWYWAQRSSRTAMSCTCQVWRIYLEPRQPGVSGQHLDRRLASAFQQLVDTGGVVLVDVDQRLELAVWLLNRPGIPGDSIS